MNTHDMSPRMRRDRKVALMFALLVIAAAGVGGVQSHDSAAVPTSIAGR